jgi:tetratricopeptide (TPR) repeat protein
MVVWSLKELAERLPQTRPWFGAAAVAALTACVVMTNLQSRYWKDTETLFRHAHEVTPRNLMTSYMLGKNLVEKGNLKEGLVYLNETLQIDPNYSAPHAVIGEAMERQGNTAAAIYHYREVLRGRPDSPPILNNLAWILATGSDSALRNGDQAIQLAERACALTDYQAPLYIGTLAAAYAEAGRYDEAVRAAGKAEELAKASGATELAEKNKKLGQLYRERCPYHQGTANK